MENPNEIRTVRCSNCGAVRQEANHWFVIAVNGGRFRCAPLHGKTDAGSAGRSCIVARRLQRTEQPVCGQQCAQKVFEKYLAQERLSRLRPFPEHERAGGSVAQPA